MVSSQAIGFVNKGLLNVLGASNGIACNVRGFTQGGEGLFPLLAWPLLMRLVKAKLLKLIEIPKLMGHC
jgi:hypothetical protein